MPVDYEKIRKENLVSYGTEIERVAQMAFADSYADRTHFIFELLQNAEDAIRRRGDSWGGNRTVSFLLSQDLLRFSHNGEPFNEKDVRGICGIGESTKSGDYTSIGRFGIGFKSVYRFTGRPEVHSGDEDFAIESFVWPKASDPIQRDPDETVFLIPLDRDNHVEDNDKIAYALEKLNVRSFLFLRQVEELEWEVEGCDSGHYVRETKIEDEIARRVNVIGHVKDLEGNESDVNEEWIVFSREVYHDGKEAGQVEIAFFVDENTGDISQLEESKLVVFFPTVVETRLGFLVQGPYRTTPNRDNVPEDDEWNRYLVNQTCVLLKDALMWLRDRNLLDTEVLQCLPLTSFPDSMLEPLFDETKKLLSTKRLLPKFDGGYVAADLALMGDSEALRGLFSEQQLSAIYGRANSWLSGDFTVDRNPELRRYLMSELGFSETAVESILRQIKPEFLESQSDGWMIRLYEFLGSQRALHRQLQRLPLIRLGDDTHVAAEIDGQPNAYLPTGDKTNFPTVKEDVCVSADALNFLESLGIKQPDLVDDVIVYILPKYRGENPQVELHAYEGDVNGILNAYTKADDTLQKHRLIGELQKTAWVMTSDTGHGRKRRVRPREVYLATDRVKNLFAGVSGVLIVDEGFECLASDDVSELLARCGATVDFTPSEFENNSRFNASELEKMRIDAQRSAGWPRNEIVQDWRVLGLEVLLATLDEMDPSLRGIKARLLWESMNDWREYQTWGTYTWIHRSMRSCRFDSEFIEQLSNRAWIPGFDGELRRPAEVDFDTLDWIPNPTLQSRLPFKPSEIKLLAQKLEFEPDVLELLKRRNLTTISKLREIGIVDDQPESDGRSNETNGSRDEGEPFAKKLFEMQATEPSEVSDHPTLLPVGGPKTAASAKKHVGQTLSIGGKGTQRRISVSRWIPTEAAKKLSDLFIQMVQSDYGKRCQVCSNAFTRSDGELQIFVMHIVPPNVDHRANNFGDLIGVCGWHYALIKYGEWSLDFSADPAIGVNNSQNGNWTHMRDSILLLRHDIDDEGNAFVSLPVQFFNVFKDWKAEPVTEKSAIRYSVPHWKYLCELLKV